MKKYLILLLIPVSLLACEKLKDLLRFDINAETEFTIPRNSVVPIPDIITPKTTSNFNEQIDNNDTRKDLVKEVKLTEFTLTIEGPSQANFDFVESMSLSIQTDSLPAIQVASISDIPETGLTTLDLVTSEAELDEYVKGDGFRVKAEITTDKTVTYDTEVIGNMTFSVKADPL